MPRIVDELESTTWTKFISASSSSRHVSDGRPESASRSAYAICSSVNLDLFIVSPCTPSGMPESKRTSSLEESGIQGITPYQHDLDGSAGENAA
jgi:hypothetical protein